MNIYYRLIKTILTIFIIFSAITITGYGYGSGYGSGGSGSSGDSRGVSTSNIDPYSNIVKYEVRDGNLIVGQPIEYSFATPEFSIYQILLNSKENEYGISVRIEDLRNTSKYAKPAPGIVYRNENVWLGSARLKYISVKFRVKNSWIKDNDLGNSRLPYLLKWNGTTWLVLRTNTTGKDETYTYFEAPRAGNSRIGIFAISAPVKRVNKETNISSRNAVSVEKYENVAPAIEEKEIKDESPKGLSGFDIVIAIVGIILSLICVGRKR